MYIYIYTHTHTHMHIYIYNVYAYTSADDIRNHALRLLLLMCSIYNVYAYTSADDIRNANKNLWHGNKKQLNQPKHINV